MSVGPWSVMDDPGDIPDWYVDGFTSAQDAEDFHQREAEQRGTHDADERAS